MDRAQKEPEDRLRVAGRVVATDQTGVGGARDLTREQVDHGRQGAAQLFGVVLRQPAVLPHQHAGVSHRAGQRDHAEDPIDVGAEPRDGLAVLLDRGAQETGTDPAVVLEQRQQQVVLATEAPVERLE